MPGPKILVPDWDARQMVELETPDGHSGYMSVEDVRSMLVWSGRVEAGLERQIALNAASRDEINQ